MPPSWCWRRGNCTAPPEISSPAQVVVVPGVGIRRLVPGDAVRAERALRAPLERVRRTGRQAQVVVVPVMRVRALVDSGAGHARDRPGVRPLHAEVGVGAEVVVGPNIKIQDRKSTRLNSSHTVISYA